jgi:ketosteroid isomerase-like protein
MHRWIGWNNGREAVGSVAPPSSSERTEEDIMTKHQDVQALLERYQQSINRKDAAATVDCYAEDVVAYDLAPPLAQDAKLVRDPKHIQQWFDTWEGPLESEEQDAVFKVDGGIAYVHALRRMHGTKTDGSKVELWFRSTTICVRVGGAWKIAHIHNSTPFAMDGSGKALLNLKP